MADWTEIRIPLAAAAAICQWIEYLQACENRDQTKKEAADRTAAEHNSVTTPGVVYHTGTALDKETG